jgi:pilus assembly protein CpaC
MKMTSMWRNMWGMVGVFSLIAAIGATVVLAENGEPVLVNVNESVTVDADNSDVAIANPAIANILLFPERNKVNVIGVKAGTTTLTIVPKDDRPVKQRVVRVTDVEAEAARKAADEAKVAEQAAIKAAADAKVALIRAMANQPGLQVRTIGDTVVLDGKVATEVEAQRAVQVAASYNAKVLNLIEVTNPRQIKIVTRVAEVNIGSLKKVGFKWLGLDGQGRYALDYSGAGSILHGLVPSISDPETSPEQADVGADVILQALIADNNARLLSEPTLVTLSGQEASFLVGQEYPIVQQLNDTFTVEYKEIGVRMKVKPVADSENRINTTIHAEVSQVVSIEPRFGIPVIGSKKANTSLQVADGKTVVIGGLLENNIGRDTLRKVPWLAEIPIFGLLFRHKDFEQAQTEVLFFMTPEVVKDIDAEVAGAARTPLMKEWNEVKGQENLLPVQDPEKDWGLHDPKNFGIPRRESDEVKTDTAPAVEPVKETAPAVVPSASTPSPKPAAAPAPAPAVKSQPAPAPAVKTQPAPATPTAKPAPAPKPAATPEPETSSPVPPKTNFGPARPAGQ